MGDFHNKDIAGVILSTPVLHFPSQIVVIQVHLDQLAELCFSQKENQGLYGRQGLNTACGPTSKHLHPSIKVLLLSNRPG